MKLLKQDKAVDDSIFDHDDSSDDPNDELNEVIKRRGKNKRERANEPSRKGTISIAYDNSGDICWCHHKPWCLHECYRVGICSSW